MSKKRSLGSSPIGYKSDDSSMGFIPDLGVSKPQESPTKVNSSKKEVTDTENGAKEQSSSKEKKKNKKKIVSYNLDVELISKVKSMAKSKDMYYVIAGECGVKKLVGRTGVR
ncbi:MAG: hypothetical protein U5J63_00540 [Fodinibius sp.]|nr:hypothetical protein [Fodinibius sp.]